MSLNITTKLYNQDLNLDCNDISEVDELKLNISKSRPENI